jgi:hypothetical protein
MNSDDYFKLDDAKRREYLARILAGGALGLLPYSLANAGWFSSSPEKLAEDKSIHSLEGTAFVNDQPAGLDTRIRAGDRVRTGDNSEMIFAVGGDSFLLRSDSEMEIAGSNFFIDGLRILTGRLLSVFAKRQPGQALTMSASTATIGIRGTGVYIEVEPELTYLCTCYGEVSLASASNPDDSELIETTNHDAPRYIADKPVKGTQIRSAPVINHSNSELKLLEAIVGRKVPKGFGKQSYRK